MPATDASLWNRLPDEHHCTGVTASVFTQAAAVGIQLTNVEVHLDTEEVHDNWTLTPL